MAAPMPADAALVPSTEAPNGAQWRPVALAESFTLSGGYMRPKRTAALQSKSVSRIQNGRVHSSTYIKVNKNDDWLLKSVGGERAQVGALRRTTAIAELREKLTAVVDPDAAVAEPEDEMGDPMAALDDVEETNPVAKSKSRYSRKRPREQEVVLTMPLYCPKARPGDTQTKDVHVMASSTNQLWVLKDDIPWLLMYLAEEHGCGGVAVDPEDNAVAEANCPTVEGLNVEWNFALNDGYRAHFVEGPLAEAQPVTCKLDQLTVEKWDSMNAIHHYGKSFHNANNVELKRAAYDYIVSHCAKLSEAAHRSCGANAVATPASSSADAAPVGASSESRADE